MSFRGLDDWITGHYGEDQPMPSSPQFDDGFVCDSCRERACGLCNTKNCSCPGKYGKSAKKHGPYLGPVKLIMDIDGGAGRHSEGGREKANAPLPSPTVIDNPGASLNDGKKD